MSGGVIKEAASPSTGRGPSPELEGEAFQEEGEE